MDGRTKIQEKIAYLEDMQGKVKQLFMQGYSVEEITKTIFPRDYPITKVSESNGLPSISSRPLLIILPKSPLYRALFILLRISQIL